MANVARAVNAPDSATLLQPHIAILLEHGFPAATWTPNAILQLPLTVPKFIKAIRVFTAAHDVAQRAAMVGIGTDLGLFFDTGSCTLLNFHYFCNFLRSTEGQIRMRERMLSLKPLSDVALLAIAKQQLKDLNAFEKEVRLRYQQQIEDLQLQIAKLEQEEEQFILDSRKKFKPMGNFVEPDGVTIDQDCYRMYLEECTQRGIVPKPGSNEHKRFGAIARDNRMLEFIKQGRSAKRLRKKAFCS